MMSRTQILFDAYTLKRAKQRAAQAGISLAEYVRGLVVRDLEQLRAVREPSAVFNLGDSGGTDIAASKDRLIAEAVEARRPRKKSR